MECNCNGYGVIYKQEETYFNGPVDENKIVIGNDYQLYKSFYFSNGGASYNIWKIPYPCGCNKGFTTDDINKKLQQLSHNSRCMTLPPERKQQ